MKAIGGVLREILGLFVSDWPQTLAIVATLAVAWFAASRVPGPAVGFGLALALIVELVAGGIIEARRQGHRRATG